MVTGAWKEGNALFRTMKRSMSEEQIPHWVPGDRRKSFMKLCHSIPDRVQKWKMLSNPDVWGNWISSSRDPEKDILMASLACPLSILLKSWLSSLP